MDTSGTPGSTCTATPQQHRQKAAACEEPNRRRSCPPHHERPTTTRTSTGESGSSAGWSADPEPRIFFTANGFSIHGCRRPNTRARTRSPEFSLDGSMKDAACLGQHHIADTRRSPCLRESLRVPTPIRTRRSRTRTLYYVSLQYLPVCTLGFDATRPAVLLHAGL